jgi:hypothetical protein
VDEDGVGEEGAVVKGTEGTVDLGGTGGVEDAAGIVGRDASTGHDDDAAIGLKDELAKQGDAGFGSGGLSGGEETRAAQCDDVLEGLIGVAGLVEGAVEGDFHTLGGIDETTAKRHVDVAVGGQCTDDYAIGSELVSEADVAEHRVGLGFVIYKIAFTRTDEDVEFQALDTTSALDRFSRGSEPVKFEGRAEFDTLGTALSGSLGACKVARTDFEDSHGVICGQTWQRRKQKGRGGL